MRRLLDVAIVVTAACAILVTGLVIRKEFFAYTPAGRIAQATPVENWKEFAATGNRIGQPNAPVVVVEFSDFQCPYCRNLARSLKTVQARYPRDLTIVYRHYPLEAIHPHARTAALASECAGIQRKFEAYHDVLYAKQDSIGLLAWDEFAERAGVPNLNQFRSCLAQGSLSKRVEADMEAGDRLGITSTPSLIIAGKLYRGAIPESELMRIVASARQES